jgi:NPCBM/NEW2 domain-containing protein
MLRLVLGFGFASVLAGAALAAGETGARVERVSGDPTSGQFAGIADGNVVLGSDAGETKVPLADVISIGFPTAPDPPQAYTPTAVAVDLSSGEILHGEIRGGDDKGITLFAPLVGQVKIAVDHIASIRWLRRFSQIPEPPDLRSAESADVLHLVGGDRMTGTVLSFTDKSVTMESTSGEKVPVAFDRVTALRVMGEPPKSPKGTLLVAALRDGSHVIGSAPASKGGRLTMASVSGFAVDLAVADVVAAHVMSDRFAYLSDLVPAKIEVKPFWKPVAGDPNVLYAPRMDRSFTGRTLKSGGRTWVKGIGVYAGTTMTWTLDGKYSEFRASTGLDDGAGTLGGVVFEVVVDGQTKWTSGFLRPASPEGRGRPSPVPTPRIDVKGAKTLTLNVLSGDAEDPWPIADEADWLGALLVR